MGCGDPYLAGGREGVVDIEQEEFVDWSVGEGFGGHSFEAAEVGVGELEVAQRTFSASSCFDDQSSLFFFSRSLLFSMHIVAIRQTIHVSPP